MTGGAFFAHGVTLALAWFAAANVVLTAAVLAVWHRAARRPPTRTASPWLALRLLPAAGSLIFVALLFVPSYLRFEPRGTAEGFDATLTACAIVSAMLLAVALARGARAWRRAARQAKAWMRAASPLADAPGWPAVYTVGASPLPLMALAGVARPRVFVSELLVAALTPEELRATLSHEASHAAAGDNLKRLAMRMAPDFLSLTRSAAALERRWASAAEHAADRAGAGCDPATRCALASALVKVARLMPPAAPTLEPISTLVGGGDIASRIEQLLHDPAAPPEEGRRWQWPAAVAMLAGAAAAYPPLLRAVHAATEILVNSLP